MTKEPVALTDLPEEIQPIAERAVLLRVQNAGMVNQIEQLGAHIEPMTARLEHFMDFLLTAGILTEIQLWQERLTWEEEFRLQLQETLQVVRNMAADRAEKARTPKLIVPGM
jgi:hypothetical protein